jgi:hypothetical protein
MIINPARAIIIMENRKMSSILCEEFGSVRDNRMEESPYSSPVMIRGISIVLFKMKACFRYSWLAISRLDPKCKKPLTIKKIRATFFMFVNVFIILFKSYYNLCE